MTTVETAIMVVPKLFVSDCTTIIAIEKIACVRPLGSPSRTSWDRSSRLGQSDRSRTCRMSRIRSRRIRHSAPETAWEMIVAHAAPATPMRNDATNQMSSTTFSPQAIIRNSSGMTESPRPRRMPDRML